MQAAISVVQSLGIESGQAKGLFAQKCQSWFPATHYRQLWNNFNHK